MRPWLAALILILISITTACNLDASSDDTETIEPATNTPDARPRPVVEIVSPGDGDEVLSNQPVLVEVRATGNADSVELFVDGRSEDNVFISNTEDNSSRSVLNFTPTQTGNIDLRVVAYRSDVTSDPIEIGLSVKSNQAQVTATSSGPIIDPNDPTCRALVDTNLNFRTSPDPNSTTNIIDLLSAGEVLPIIGRLRNGTWLQLRSGGNIGWVSAAFVTPYGNCSSIAIIDLPNTPIPTNTPRPTTTPFIATQTPRPSETPSPPNLMVRSIDGPQTVTIPSGRTSITVEYDIVVTNQGGAFGTQFSNIGIILPTGGTTFDFGTAAGLGINQSISLSGEVTFTEAGTFALQITADADSEVEESNEADNAAILNVTVATE